MTALKLSDLDYPLPPGRVAQYPAERRTGSRLLCVDKGTGERSHHRFFELPQLLKRGDVLVLNDTKVLPARLVGRKETQGKVEALLLSERGPDTYEALLKPSGRVRRGSRLEFGENGLRLAAEVLDGPRPESGARLLKFYGPGVREGLKRIGRMPLPPYLGRPDEIGDRERYQTVFAREEGAVAAPTAGLHFDENLLGEIRQAGVEVVFVTLHVGYGTFRPLVLEEIAHHRMETEAFEIPEGTAAAVNRARSEGRRVIACGTTSVRALESAVDAEGRVQAVKGETRLFIYPPYRFRTVEGLITNFHLPRSSLLLLVSAFLGHERLMAIYEEAVRRHYRFYSYGDAMLIL